MFFKQLRKVFFGMSLEEGSFERRGFEGGSPQARERLGRVGYLFLQGYNLAVEEGAPTSTLVERLGHISPEMQGFAFEGAAMGLALLDYFTPWNRYRVRSFLDGAGGDHMYMVHVGVGFAFARLPAPVESCLKGLDRLLGWLAIDGYGFHEGFFYADRCFEQQASPKGLSDYGRRVFDQGLGRSLWFVKVADVARISSTIDSFPSSRHADLWSGIGLACTYAGGADRASIEALRRAAGTHAPALAQGAAFAAKARLHAGNMADHTRLATELLCAMSAEDAADITDITLERLPTNGPLPAYEVWRQRIQQHFQEERISI
ncbi:MAG: DUF1702 family protein [Ardenticatenaceae bacterium]